YVPVASYSRPAYTDRQLLLKSQGRGGVPSGDSVGLDVIAAITATAGAFLPRLATLQQQQAAQCQQSHGGRLGYHQEVVLERRAPIAAHPVGSGHVGEPVAGVT